jgi:Na+-driven multidrug efflux pump
MICVGFGVAAETLVGQNLGARNPRRARRAGWLTVEVTTVPMACFGLLFLLVPELLAGVFTRDPEVIAAAALYLRAVAAAQLATALENVLEGALTGAGYTLQTMVAVVALSAVRIPLAALAAPRFGLAGVWWVLSLTAIARGLAMTALFVWGAWERSEA